LTATAKTLRSSPLLSWRGALLLVIPIGCAVLYARDPADGGIYPACPFRAITGLDCPGCGTGRALHRVLHGRIDEAFTLNPLATLLLPVLAVALLASVWTAATGRALPRVRMPSWTGWAVTALFLAFWVARNLPWTPFAWMASYR
jgi:hypothetical protein